MIEISAFDIAPNDSHLAKNIFSFLEELFKADGKILLKENNKRYEQSEIIELAEAIVALHEKEIHNKEEGGNE